MRLVLLSEEKKSPADLGKADHLSGMRVIQDLGVNIFLTSARRFPLSIDGHTLLQF